MADNLQNLLDLLNETGVIHGFRQLDMPKVARTFAHSLCTGLASKLTIDRSEEGVVKTTIAWFRFVVLHCLGVKDMANTHVLNLLRRHQAELDLLDGFERSARVGEVKIRHGVG